MTRVIHSQRDSSSRVTTRHEAVEPEVTGEEQLERCAQDAVVAFEQWSVMAPPARARALVAAADGLCEFDDELVALAMGETGLAESRLRGELNRTAVQLRLFADVVVDGDYLDVRIDAADADFALGARPDLRRALVPLGPVLNFSGGNFPFAFSVAGGDTASALAAGCSVIVKAHPGHPALSRRTAEVVAAALAGAGAPANTLQVIFGQDQGVAMLADGRIRAATFTGSIRAGRLLADVAARRPRPIPFYGELGSVNPQFVTRARLAEDVAELGAGFVASVASSAGQFCTKPGFLFVSDVSALAGPIRAAAEQVAEHRMLNPRIAAGYGRRREEVLATPGVEVIALGSMRVDENAQGWVTPTIVSVDVPALQAAGATLLDESFGPLAILVQYEEESSLAELAGRLFPGNLTSGVHALVDESTPALIALLDQLQSCAGRILFNGWPTGVAVTPAMQHGGPWPATTADVATSVGTAAIGRFLRGVSYQNFPQHLLAPMLRDDNPWGVPQRLAPAGESTSWGDRSRDPR